MITARLYSDDRILDLAPFLDQMVLTRSTSDEEADLRCRVPWGMLSEQDLSLDWWLLLRREDQGVEGPALFLGRVTAISWGVRAATGETPEGGRVAIPVLIRAESWLSPMKRGQIFLSGRGVGAPGHVYDLRSWGPTMREILSAPFTSNNVGEVLARLFDRFAPHYRLPSTIAGGASFSSLPVVYSPETAQRFTRDRAGSYRGVYGLALNTAQAAFPGGASPFGLLQSLFGADPNLVELFPCTEPIEVPGGQVSPVVGGTPSLIFRLRPFISGRLDTRSASSAQVAQEQTAGAADLARVLALDSVIELNLSRDDSARVNFVYLDTPASQSRGIDGFGLYGSPRLDLEDIARNGLRPFRGSWPFFPRGSRSAGPTIRDQIQAVIDLAAAIVGQSHRFLTGSLLLAYDPELLQGEWIRLPSPGGSEGDLVMYAEAVQHMITVLPSGAITARSRVQFMRGFYGVEPVIELGEAAESGEAGGL